MDHRHPDSQSQNSGFSSKTNATMNPLDKPRKDDVSRFAGIAFACAVLADARAMRQGCPQVAGFLPGLSGVGAQRLGSLPCFTPLRVNHHDMAMSLCRIVTLSKSQESSAATDSTAKRTGFEVCRLGNGLAEFEASASSCRLSTPAPG
jgi:hypothetical protein